MIVSCKNHKFTRTHSTITFDAVHTVDMNALAVDAIISCTNS